MLKYSLLFCLLGVACSTVPNDISQKAALSCQGRGFSITNQLGQSGWVDDTPYEQCYHQTLDQLLRQ